VLVLLLSVVVLVESLIHAERVLRYHWTLLGKLLQTCLLFPEHRVGYLDLLRIVVVINLNPVDVTSVIMTDLLLVLNACDLVEAIKVALLARLEVELAGVVLLLGRRRGRCLQGLKHGVLAHDTVNLGRIKDRRLGAALFKNFTVVKNRALGQAKRSRLESFPVFLVVLVLWLRRKEGVEQVSLVRYCRLRSIKFGVVWIQSAVHVAGLRSLHHLGVVLRIVRLVIRIWR